MKNPLHIILVIMRFLAALGMTELETITRVGNWFEIGAPKQYKKAPLATANEAFTLKLFGLFAGLADTGGDTP